MLPLTNKMMGYVGSISYSLYLWHFPVVILLAAVVPAESQIYVPLAFLLMFGLSVAAYHGVEKRILDGIWLDYSEAANKERRRRKRNGSHVQRRLSLQFAAVGTLAVVAFGMAGYALTTSAGSSQPQAAVLPTVPAQPAEATDPQSVLTLEIEAALKATSWPNLEPSLDSFASHQL